MVFGIHLIIPEVERQGSDLQCISRKDIFDANEMMVTYE